MCARAAPGRQLLVLEFSTVKLTGLKPCTTSIPSRCCRGSAQWVANDGDSYRYLAESIRKHPDQETLLGMMRSAPASRTCATTTCWRASSPCTSAGSFDMSGQARGAKDFVDPLLSRIEDALSLALSRLLNSNPDTAARLAALEGCVIELALRDSARSAYALPGANGVKLKRRHDGAVAVKVSGRVADFLAYARASRRGDSLGAGRIEIAGDLAVAQQVQALLAELSIDWERGERLRLALEELGPDLREVRPGAVDASRPAAARRHRRRTREAAGPRAAVPGRQRAAHDRRARLRPQARPRCSRPSTKRRSPRPRSPRCTRATARRPRSRRQGAAARHARTIERDLEVMYALADARRAATRREAGACAVTRSSRSTKRPSSTSST
jgi:predicted lipid carrier protein YhbT